MLNLQGKMLIVHQSFMNERLGLLHRIQSGTAAIYALVLSIIQITIFLQMYVGISTVRAALSYGWELGRGL